MVPSTAAQTGGVMHSGGLAQTAFEGVSHVGAVIEAAERFCAIQNWIMATHRT